mmetsp:Transcript_18758/g.34765  ORF Transcript_18758/g.34765 Transcript_18758/m.34765 type:complete len:303 (+) Transcript_18758:818-1726(+)
MEGGHGLAQEPQPGERNREAGGGTRELDGDVADVRRAVREGALGEEGQGEAGHQQAHERKGQRRMGYVGRLCQAGDSQRGDQAQVRQEAEVQGRHESPGELEDHDEGEEVPEEIHEEDVWREGPQDEERRHSNVAGLRERLQGGGGEGGHPEVGGHLQLPEQRNQRPAGGPELPAQPGRKPAVGEDDAQPKGHEELHRALAEQGAAEGLHGVEESCGGVERKEGVASEGGPEVARAGRGQVLQGLGPLDQEDHKGQGEAHCSQGGRVAGLPEGRANSRQHSQGRQCPRRRRLLQQQQPGERT